MVSYTLLLLPKLKSINAALSITEGGGISFIRTRSGRRCLKMLLEATKNGLFRTCNRVALCARRKLLRRQWKEPPVCDVQMNQDYVEVLKMVALISTTGIQCHNMRTVLSLHLIQTISDK